MINLYLIYIPNNSDAKWEAMSDLSVPDPGAFPAHWYKKYEVPSDKYEEMLKKIRTVKDEMNEKKVIPIQERNIFPELSDILKAT